MSYRKRICAVFLAVVLVMNMSLTLPGTKVHAEKVVTKDSWVDPGNYTRGWYDAVTGLDIYGNAGTEEDPYEIKSAKDLAGLAYYSNISTNDTTSTEFAAKNIVVTVDEIDLSEHYWYPIGNVRDFKANFEGNGVTIKNMFIGNENYYEACGRVGLFGTIHGNVSNVHIENAVIYANSINTGGFVGACGGGKMTNCTVTGQINSIAHSACVGGFIGYYNCTNGQSTVNCSAQVTVNSSTANSSSVGGFAGYLNNVYMANCFSKGNVSCNNSCKIAGFIGSIDYNATIINCFSAGNVNAGTSCDISGFIGNYYVYGSTICVDNCYRTGDVSGAAGSLVSGFLGRKRYANITRAKKCYYNITSEQVLDGIARENDSKIAASSETLRTIQGAYESYMKSEEFLADLNEYVYQNNQYIVWKQDPHVNDGFPYLDGTKTALIEIKGEQKDITISSQSDNTQVSMNVYGNLEFPEIEEENEPTPEDAMVSVSITWGSLEYDYKSGDYDKETETFEDGTWSPKESGVTDKISVTNHSDSEIKACYIFYPNTSEESSFSDLAGFFNLGNTDNSIDTTLQIGRKQGDIEITQDVFLGIEGIPNTTESTDNPEVIGNVVLTIMKVSDTPAVTEPEEGDETTATEETVDTSEPVVSEDVVVSQEPDGTEETMESTEPDTSEDVEYTEGTVNNDESDDVVESEEPEPTDAVVEETAPTLSSSPEDSSESDNDLDSTEDTTVSSEPVESEQPQEVDEIEA